MSSFRKIYIFFFNKMHYVNITLSLPSSLHITAGTILIKLAVKCTFSEFYNNLKYCFFLVCFEHPKIAAKMITIQCIPSMYICIFAIGNLHSNYSNKYVEK